MSTVYLVSNCYEDINCRTEMSYQQMTKGINALDFDDVSLPPRVINIMWHKIDGGKFG